VTCTEFLGKLDDYFDGKVDADVLAEVRAHVKKCSHCEVVLDTTRKTSRSIARTRCMSFPMHCANGCMRRSWRSAAKRRCEAGRSLVVEQGETRG